MTLDWTHFTPWASLAGGLVLLQGLAEMVRCVVCIRTGEWTPRLKDADEIDVVEQHALLPRHRQPVPHGQCRVQRQVVGLVRGAREPLPGDAAPPRDP